MDPDGRFDSYSVYNGTSEALKYASEVIAADAVIPEPSDILPHKWIIYGVLLGGLSIACGITYLINNCNDINQKLNFVLPPGYSQNNGVISGPNGTVQTSNDAWNEYNGNDIYVGSEKHNANAKGKASVAPKNAESMFYKSVRDPKIQNKRWYKDKNGVIHRFQGSKQGNNVIYHWNGSTNTKNDPIKENIIPKDIKRAECGEIE